MFRYILKRLLWLIPIVIVVAITIFTIMFFVPGDPTSTLIGTSATEAQRQELLESLGLTDPYFVQLGRFLYNLFIKFDLGNSYIYGSSVSTELMNRLPITARIAVICCVLQAAIGIPIGVNAAVHQNSLIDRITIVIAMIGQALPQFWVGLMLVILFSLRLNILPSYGVSTWQGYILPCTAIIIGGFANIARQTRSQMLEVIRSDFIVTARAKGIPERTIRYRYALPNALIPVITGIGTQFGRALGGTVVIETLFSIPGVGMYLVDAISQRDYPVVRGGVVVLAILFSLIVLLTDISYAVIDPRIKAQYEGKGKRRAKKDA
ncbi:MAG: ABC transporter permease [Lachnospiraceae bacterium]|nr:ABC transporter permease [Lachnospiraceae bacterium]